MSTTRYQFNVKDQYQVSNFSRPLGIYVDEEYKRPVLHSEIWPLPALELVSISITEPRLFSPLGDTDAETDRAIGEAISCGDPSLLPDPRESEDWHIRQQLVKILEGKVSEWKLVAANIDACGASLVIVHRDPLPDGRTQFREYLLPTTRSHTFTVRTADGCLHTYLQMGNLRDQRICLIRGNLTGDCELCFVSESCLAGCATLVDVIRYQQ